LIALTPITSRHVGVGDARQLSEVTLKVRLERFVEYVDITPIDHKAESEMTE
jgi:hypothetical protein